jgi:hypothetical protein
MPPPKTTDPNRPSMKGIIPRDSEVPTKRRTQKRRRKEFEAGGALVPKEQSDSESSPCQLSAKDDAER